MMSECVNTEYITLIDDHILTAFQIIRVDSGPKSVGLRRSKFKTGDDRFGQFGGQKDRLHDENGGLRNGTQ